MPSPLEPQKIRNLGIYGVIRQAEVDDSLIPDGAVTEAQNVSFDRKGAIMLRPGLAGLGSTVLASRPAVGIHNAQSGTAIAVFSNGSSATIYTLTSGAWGVSLDGGTASVRIRFVDFGSYTITPNFMYNTYSSMRFWNAGSSRHWHFTGNPINPQNMWGYNIQLVEVYKSRIYAAGDPAYPGRLFFSSVITSAGNVTWAPTVDYVDINPNDGEDTKGLKRYSLELLVFKPNYIYRFRTSGVDPDPLIKIGTRSQESIVEGKRGLYFHHDTGYYRYTGGYPEEISRPISDFITAIPFSQFANVVGWRDADHIYWSVGNLTISEPTGDVAWKNVVLRYTESSDIWTIYSYPSDIRAGTDFNNGSSLTRIIATDNGVVATHNSGTTDLGEPIKYRVSTKWYEFGSIADQKVIKTIIGLCEKAQESQLMYQVDDDASWKPLGQLAKYLTFYEPLLLKFHRIRFRLMGVSRVEPFVFQGLEILEGTNEGPIKQ